MKKEPLETIADLEEIQDIPIEILPITEEIPMTPLHLTQIQTPIVLIEAILDSDKKITEISIRVWEVAKTQWEATTHSTAEADLIRGQALDLLAVAEAETLAEWEDNFS